MPHLLLSKPHVKNWKFRLLPIEILQLKLLFISLLGLHIIDHRQLTCRYNIMKTTYKLECRIPYRPSQIEVLQLKYHLHSLFHFPTTHPQETRKQQSNMIDRKQATYISVEHLHSLFGLFNSAHCYKPKPTTLICFSIVNYLQIEREKHQNPKCEENPLCSNN